MTDQYLFQLPNDTHLSYAYPWDLTKIGGSQFKWYRSFYSYQVVSQIPKSKDRAPRIGLWSARGNQKIICADYDVLPKGFTRWQKFFDAMKQRFPNDFVFRSQSGKVKIFFLVELKTGFINGKMARYMLQKILGEKLFKAADTSLLGMSVCYTHPIMVAGFRRWLESSPTPRRVNLAPLFRKVSDHHFKAHKGTLPKHLRTSFIRGSRAKEMFCRILLRQRRMAMKSGFDIPTTKFALELGVNQKTVHRWREELVELGFIRCVDETYKINKKAMTFKASGLFRKIVIQIFKQIKTKTEKGTFVDLPESIADGSWHETLWKLSRYFIDDPNEFFNWVKSLPDSDKRRREQKALSAMRSRFKYNGIEQVIW